MRGIVRPAAVYAAVVFACGFVLGTLRVLLIGPRIGETAAVALEVPLVLAIAWITAGAVLRRWPLPGRVLRAAMGALAFALLMAAELALGSLGFGRALADMLAAFAAPAGAIGLAGQVGFGLIPMLRPASG